MGRHHTTSCDRLEFHPWGTKYEGGGWWDDTILHRVIDSSFIPGGLSMRGVADGTTPYYIVWSTRVSSLGTKYEGGGWWDDTILHRVIDSSFIPGGLSMRGWLMGRHHTTSCDRLEFHPWGTKYEGGGWWDDTILHRVIDSSFIPGGLSMSGVADGTTPYYMVWSTRVSSLGD